MYVLRLGMSGEDAKETGTGGREGTLVTSFRVLPLWTLSLMRLTARVEMARQACVSTRSWSLCACKHHHRGL